VQEFKKDDVELVQGLGSDVNATGGKNSPFPSPPKTKYGKDMVGYPHPYLEKYQCEVISSTPNKIIENATWKSVEIVFVHVETFLHLHS